MTAHHASGAGAGPDHVDPTGGGWRAAVEWVLGIVGAVAVFMGLFVLLGGDDQFVGIGGDVSWRVGDIASGWGFGLIVGGILAIAFAVASALSRRR